MRTPVRLAGAWNRKPTLIVMGTLLFLAPLGAQSNGLRRESAEVVLRTTIGLLSKLISNQSERFIPTNETIFVAAYLTRMDIPNAQAALERLFEAIRRSALAAVDSGRYEASAAAVGSVLEHLALLSSNRAVALFASFPKPSPAFGPGGERFYRIAERGLQTRILLTLAEEDPLRAVKMIREDPGLDVGFVVWTALLRDSRLRSEAADTEFVLERSLARLESQGWPSDLLGHLIPFATAVQAIRPGLETSIIRTIAVKIREMTAPAWGRYEVDLSGRTIPLDHRQYQTLSLCLTLRPKFENLANLLLESSPDLHEKIRDAGGLVAAGNGFMLRKLEPRGGELRTGGDEQEAMQLLDRLRGQADRSPERVREILLDTFDSPDSFGKLVASASYSRVEDPGLSRVAYDSARRLITRQSSSEARGDMLETLLSSLASAEKVLAPEWFEFGFSELSRLGERARESPSGFATESRRNRLEKLLLAEWALSDFDRAWAALGEIDDDHFRLQACIKMLAAHRRNLTGRPD